MRRRVEKRLKDTAENVPLSMGTVEKGSNCKKSITCLLPDLFRSTARIIGHSMDFNAENGHPRVVMLVDTQEELDAQRV